MPDPTSPNGESEYTPEPLPPVIAAMLEHLAPGEDVIAAASADLLRDGDFGDEWLVATGRRVLVFAPGPAGAAAPAVDLPLRDIRKLERRDFHGITRLEAHTDGRAVVLALYSRFRGEFFERFAARVREEAGLPEEADHRPRKPAGGPSGDGRHRHTEARICPACGKPIPPKLGLCLACIDKGRIIRRLLARVRPYSLIVALGLLLMLVLTAVDMVQPLLTKVLIDRVFPQKDMHLFAWVVAGIAVIYAVGPIFTGIRTYMMAWFGERLVHDIRRELYDHLQELSVDFYDRNQTGWIMDRITSDTGNLQDFLSEGLQRILRDIMAVLVIIAIMFSMNWQLALVTLIPAPVIAVLSFYYYRRVHRLYHAVWRKRSRMASLLTDVIPGVRIVKAFAQEGRESERFFERSRQYMQTSVRAHRFDNLFGSMIDFVFHMGFLMVWGYGGYRVITTGDVSAGTLVAFVGYLWRFYGPLESLTRLGQRLQRAATAAQRVFEILDTAPTVKNPDSRREMPLVRGRVEFKAVTFAYEPGENVIQDMAFSVAPGEMVGLVGPSGAGKSTTINLLCRFYDVTGGAIEIDGVDIRDVTLVSLRRQIGVVPQDPFLFHGTIAENIAYGRPDADVDDILRAAKAANSHDFIMAFPDGYDTLVGERGQRLSGGERQRIAIARAILKDPRILILDEATSSVDTETESAIREAIDRLVHGRTTFAIAHRFSTLRNAQRLIVLEKGRVVEVGTHAELLAKENGVFRRLSDLQAEMARIVAIGG
ncbi:MAG: ABC transporter ATP-binding protein [Planctomycetota bacterium]